MKRHRTKDSNRPHFEMGVEEWLAQRRAIALGQRFHSGDVERRPHVQRLATAKKSTTWQDSRDWRQN